MKSTGPKNTGRPLTHHNKLLFSCQLNAINHSGEFEIIRRNSHKKESLSNQLYCKNESVYDDLKNGRVTAGYDRTHW
jgi:hypothetical protein